MTDWLSVKDAAEISGYSRKQILRLIHSGKIKADVFVRVYRVDRKSLATYVKEARKKGLKPGPKSGA
jgi:excisionase family DNA binding protein